MGKISTLGKFLTSISSILNDCVNDGASIAGDFSNHRVRQRSLFNRQKLVQSQSIKLHRIIQVSRIDRHKLHELLVGKRRRGEIERSLCVVFANFVGELLVLDGWRCGDDDKQAASALRKTFDVLARLVFAELLDAIQIFFCFPARID